MASAASSAALDEFIGLHMGDGERHHGIPAQIMLPLDKFIEFFFMALGAYLFIGKYGEFVILDVHVFVAVALNTAHIFSAVFAGSPIRHLTGRNLAVAFDAGIVAVFSRFSGNGYGREKKDQK
jgi:hypothetical protein